MTRTQIHNASHGPRLGAGILKRLPLLMILAPLCLGTGAAEISLGGKCYNCEPPEITSVTANKMVLKTTDQSPEDPDAIASSYLGGVVTDYQSSPGATSFRQSVFRHADGDWLFDVELDTNASPSTDLAASLRKVDEPNVSPDSKQNECPMEVPNVLGAFITIDQADIGFILEDFYHCRQYFPETPERSSWFECHNEGEEWPYLEPMIRRVKYHQPPLFGCLPIEPVDVCVEVADIRAEFRE